MAGPQTFQFTQTFKFDGDVALAAKWPPKNPLMHVLDQILSFILQHAFE